MSETCHEVKSCFIVSENSHMYLYVYAYAYDKVSGTRILKWPNLSENIVCPIWSVIHQK